jgi:chromosome segregation ATPase
MDLRNRRLLLLIVCVLLAGVIASTLLAGCSDDQSQARQYVLAALKKSEKVTENETRFQQKSKELQKFSEMFDTITPGVANTLKQYYSDLVLIHEQIEKAAKDTRPYYDKVLNLKDATDYKAYALDCIKAVDLISQRTQLIKDLAATFEQVLNAAMNGQQADEAALQAKAAQINQKRAAIDKQLSELKDSVADLSKKLNIH